MRLRPYSFLKDCASVSTGASLDPKFHRWLLDTFDLRILGDYEVEISVSADEAAQVLTQAEEFVTEARRHLGIM